MSLYEKETSLRCQWHLPEPHYREAWGEPRAFGGTASICQPLIEPLYRGKSAHEVLAAVTGKTQPPGHEIVREHWRKHWQDPAARGSRAGVLPARTATARARTRAARRQTGRSRSVLAAA